MNRNQRHADLLGRAAQVLRGVDVASAKDFEPQLRAARQLAIAVWGETIQDPAYARARKDFRSAIASVQSVLRASEEGQPIPAADGELVAAAAATLETLAADAAERTDSRRADPDGMGTASFATVDDLRDFVTSPKREVAAVKGSGYREPAERDRVSIQMERGLQTLSELTADLSHLNELRSKLPRAIGDRPYVVVRMPVVVFTGKPLNRNEMNRSGAKWVKQADEAVVLFDQVVLGFEEVDTLLDSHARRSAFKRSKYASPTDARESPIKLPTRFKVKPGDVSKALAAVGQRVGRRVVATPDAPFFRVRDNPLVWVWAAQPLLVGLLAPKRVTFPLSSVPSHAELKGSTERLQAELNRLEGEAIEAMKIGRTLKDSDIERLSHLRERLDRDSKLLATQKSPAERAEHVRKLRELAESELRRQYGPLVAEVEEQRMIIRDLPAKDRPKAQRELGRLVKQLDAAREQVARQLRSRA